LNYEQERPGIGITQSTPNKWAMTLPFQNLQTCVYRYFAFFLQIQKMISLSHHLPVFTFSVGGTVTSSKSYYLLLSITALGLPDDYNSVILLL